MGECVNGLGGSGHTFTLPTAKSIMITCQHEWIEQCQIKYRYEPLPEGEHWEDAHYPIPRSLGGTETVKLWSRDHAVHGPIQSENLNQVCLDGRRFKFDRALIEEHYPVYLDLYDKWYKESKARAGRASCIKRNEEDTEYWDKTLGKYLAENPNHAQRVAKKLKEEDPEYFSRHFQRTLGKLQENKEAYSEMCRKNFLKRLEEDPDYQSKAFQKLLEKNPNHQSDAAKTRWEKKPDKSQIRNLGTQKYFDPEHPELGEHNVGVLVRKQKKLGLPHGKENRRLVG